MRFVENSKIDRVKWDKAILNSKQPLVFAMSFYLDSVSPEWCALIENDYESVFPLTIAKKFGIKYLIQPPFTPQLGAFGKSNLLFEKSALDYIQSNFKFVDIEFNANMQKVKFCTDKKTFVLSDKTEIKLNTNTKRNLKKSEKLGVAIQVLSNKGSITNSKKIIDPFLRKKIKLPVKHIQIFNLLLKNSMDQNKLITFAAVKDENVIGLAHFITNGKHAVYLKGNSLEKESGAMHSICYYAMNYFFKIGVQLFDFGGGQIESLARFYSGFGATPLVYYRFKINNLPNAVKWFKR
ncbi:MAG: hypothetical protein IPM51_05230 [Sphingobacteriaceae bacterium]|nr:hypothetical protein [Sphingobacteriaceae bacterium]